MNHMKENGGIVRGLSTIYICMEEYLISYNNSYTSAGSFDFYPTYTHNFCLLMLRVRFRTV